MAKFDQLLGRLRTKDDAIEKVVKETLEIRGGGSGGGTGDFWPRTGNDLGLTGQYQIIEPNALPDPLIAVFNVDTRDGSQTGVNGAYLGLSDQIAMNMTSNTSIALWGVSHGTIGSTLAPTSGLWAVNDSGTTEGTAGATIQNTATSAAGGLGFLAQSNLGISALFMTQNSAGTNTYPTLVVRLGAGSPTADLQQWQGNDGSGGAGATIAKVDYIGQGTFTGLNTTSTLAHKVKTITNADTPYTAAAETVILCDASSGVITVDLPASTGVTDRTHHIKKIDSSANAITIDANGTETIDGTLTKTLAAQYDNIQVISDGSNWHIL